MKETIPSTTHIVCDICRNPRAPRLTSAELRLKRDALDWQNAPCADASVSFDLCDDCATAVVVRINEAANARGIQYSQDGDMRCATFHDFVDLQASPAGFGATDELAKAALLKEATP